MAVSIPSELIVDVMRNADPSRLKAATAKLEAIGGKTTDFAHIIGVSQTAGAPDLSQRLQSGTMPSDVYVDFERMVLRSLLDSLLPPETSGSFGTGPSAGVWRSLVADQLAGLYAESGGIGIAAEISSDRRASSSAEQPQWPYFRSDDIKAFAG